MVAKKKKQRRLVLGMESKPPPVWVGRKEHVLSVIPGVLQGFLKSSRGKKDVSHLKGFTTLITDKEDRRS